MVEILAAALILLIFGFAVGFGSGVGFAVYGELFGVLKRRRDLTPSTPAPEHRPPTMPDVVPPETSDEYEALDRVETRTVLIEGLARIVLSAASAALAANERRPVTDSPEDRAALCDRAVDVVVGNPKLVLKEHEALWREVALEIIARRDACKPVDGVRISESDLRAAREFGGEVATKDHASWLRSRANTLLKEVEEGRDSATNRERLREVDLLYHALTGARLDVVLVPREEEKS